MKSKLRGIAVGFSALALTGLSAGCLNLDEEIVTGVTQEYFSTESGARDALKASYFYLRTWLPADEEWFSMTQLGTDIWLEGNDGSQKYFNRYDVGMNAGSEFVRTIWDALYEGINTANTAIERITAVETFDEETKAQMIAEARFLRALMYLDLVRHWGDVHLTLEATTEVETDATRTAVSQIFAEAIIPDLQNAAQTLGPEPRDGEFGRATRGAANHFLGLAYLTRGEAGDYENAATVLADVVNSGMYDLEEDYARTFALDNELSREIVFSVQFSPDATTWGDPSFANRLHLFWGMVYDTNFPGMTRDIENDRPFRRIRPSPCLLALWDRGVDVRYEESFKTVWFANHEASLPDGMALGDTAIYMPGVDVSDAEIEAEIYALIPPRNYSPIHFPTLWKHLDPTRPTIVQEQSGRDFIIARLADTKLLLAEALIRTGRAGEALAQVNEVRQRAAKPGLEAEMMVGADQMTLDFILDERARELAGEGSEPRWLTLKRFDKLIERVSQTLPFEDPYDGNAHLGACNPLAAANVQDHHLLRPIPSTQIDRTTSQFAQNPGY